MDMNVVPTTVDVSNVVITSQTVPMDQTNVIVQVSQLNEYSICSPSTPNVVSIENSHSQDNPFFYLV